MSPFPRVKAIHAIRAVLAAVLATVACVDLNVGDGGAVVSVRVAPDTLILQVGDTARLKASPLDATAAFLGQKTPTWSSGAPAVATVNASGLVLAVAPGTGTILATADGVAGQAVVLVSGAPATVAVVAGNAQSAAVNAAVTVPPAVRVTDAAGNAVPLVAVAFAVTGGGGTVTPGSVLTGLDGIAAATAWTLGPSAGPNTLSATVAGSGLTGNPAMLTATGTVGSPSAAQSSIQASPATIVPSSGLSFATITVTVRDSAGSTISGATVVLAATGTGNLLTQPTAVTNLLGRATGALSSSVAETKKVSAIVNGSVSLADSATVTVTASAPAGLAVASQPAGAVSNAAFATQPAVEIRDAFGNRVVTATDPVTVTLVAGNGTLVSGGSFTVNAVSGRATFSGLLIRGLRTTRDTLGTGPHLLQFSAPGYTAVRSDTFQVGVSYAYNVVDVYTRYGCIGCHSFTYANSVNQPSSLAPCAPRTRIVAGDTVNSVIYEKIRTATPACGIVMPTSGLIPSVLQIRLVRDWILQGAPNN